MLNQNSSKRKIIGENSMKNANYINFFTPIFTLFLSFCSFNTTAEITQLTESNGSSLSKYETKRQNQLQNTREICSKFSNASIPENDYPTEARTQELINCNSKNLYYGIGTTADPVRARECAILEFIKNENQEMAYDISGSTILMMIYANGKGVERNLDLAINLACSHVPFCAQEARVEHLFKLKNEHWQGNNFSVCDNITSGSGSSACADLNESLVDQKRLEKLVELSKNWSQPEKAALFKLKEMAYLFIASHVEREKDLGGSARGQFIIEEVTQLRDHFLSLVQEYENNKYHSYTESDLKIVDLKLNQSYTKLKDQIQKSGKIEEFYYKLVTFDDVLATQRLWIKYKDAWANFINLRYPNLEKNSIKTVLTEQRTQMLTELMN